MWGLLMVFAGAAEPESLPAPPPEPVDTTSQFNTGKGIALTGLGLGVAGNLIGIYGTISLFDDIDPTTNQVDPAAVEALLPLAAAGNLMHNGGATLMGIGTLQMHGANRKAGAEYTRLFGELSVGFGIGATALTAGWLVVSRDAPPGSTAAGTASILSLSAGGLGLASFSTAFIQYTLNHTNRPARRRRITDSRLRPHLVPTHNGAALVGRF